MSNLISAAVVFSVLLLAVHRVPSQNILREEVVDNEIIQRLVINKDLLKKALRSDRPKARLEAVIAAGQLDESDSELNRAIVARLSESSPQIQTEAARSLGQLGYSSPEGIEELISQLSSEHDRVVAIAAVALSKLSTAPTVIEAITNRLHHRHAYVRERVAYALSKIELSPSSHTDVAAHLTSELMKCLNDKDHNVREMAAYALANIAPHSEDVIDALARLLSNDMYVSVRESAAFALAKIGPPAESAITILVRELGNPDPDVRENVAYALGEIEMFDEQAFSQLLNVIVIEENPQVLRAAELAIGRIIRKSAQRTGSHLVVLRKGLTSEIETVQRTTLRVLSGYPESKKLVPELFSVFNSDNIDRKRMAAGVLAGVGPFGPEYFDAIVEAVSVNDQSVKLFAIDALRWYGERGDEVVEHLLPFVDGTDVLLQEKAIFGLANIGPIARAAGPALAKALESDSEQIQSLAAWALAEIEPASDEPVPALIQLLGTTNPKTLENVVFAIRKLGQHANVAWPELIVLLSHRSSSVRRHVVETLNKADIDLSHEGLIPDLINALRKLRQSDLTNERICVISCLGRIGVVGDEIKSVLFDELRDGTPIVRRAVVKLIAELTVDWPEAEELLGELLSDQDDVTVYWATVAILNMESRAEAAWPYLVSTLEHDSVDIRRSSMRKLREARFDDASLANKLCEIADTSLNEESRRFAIECLGMVKPNSENVRRTIIKALKEQGRPEIQAVAIRASVNVGANWSDAAQTIGAILNTWDFPDDVLLDAARALERMDDNSRPGWSAVIKAFNHENPNLWQLATKLMDRMTLNASDANLSDDLWIALPSKYPEARRTAHKCLLEIGPRSLEAIRISYEDERQKLLLKERSADLENTINEIVSGIGDNESRHIPLLEETASFLESEKLSSEKTIAKLEQLKSNQNALLERRSPWIGYLTLFLFGAFCTWVLVSGKASSSPSSRKEHRNQTTSPPPTRSPAPPTKPASVFISYAREDEGLKDQLVNHLASLESQRIIKVWHDREINAGDPWKDKIDSKINSADIILLLISADFLASDYCRDVELERAMERREKEETRVIPVILRDVDLADPRLSDLQVSPKDGRPVDMWSNRDAVLADVAREIREASLRIHNDDI